MSGLVNAPLTAVCGNSCCCNMHLGGTREEGWFWLGVVSQWSRGPVVSGHEKADHHGGKSDGEQCGSPQGGQEVEREEHMPA